MGMHGQGQPEERAIKDGPAKITKRSQDLSSLYVIVRLKRAANGKGSVAGAFPSVYSS